MKKRIFTVTAIGLMVLYENWTGNCDLAIVRQLSGKAGNANNFNKTGGE